MDQKIGIIVVLLFCAVWQVQSAVNCTATGAGRQADPDDSTCQNYTLCVYIASTNTYVSYNYVCPTGSLFNPNTAQCSANYTCTANETTTNTTTSSSVCTEDGFVADPNVTDCSSYIECVQINGTFVETTYTCTNGTFYDPTTTLCESNYTCTTTSTFSCTTAGRFADTTDTTCQAYFFCVLGTDDTYTQYNYTCPSTSVFNPNSRLCTTNYTCTN